MEARRSYADGDRVEILITARGVQRWESGAIAGSHASQWEDEDFQRLDVRMPDGRQFNGCHPDCVRPVTPERVA